MHWDRDCKYNKDKQVRTARTMFVDTDCSSEDIMAELEYEKCYDNCLNQESQDEQVESEKEESTSPPTSDDSELSDF